MATRKKLVQSGQSGIVELSDEPQPRQLYIWDIETISQPEERLNELMPEEIKNPRMPEALESPVMPVFLNKAIKDEQKQSDWRQTKIDGWREEHREKIAKWNLDATNARLKWIDKACLYGETGIVPLIGVMRPDKFIDIFFVGEPLKDEDAARIASACQYGYLVSQFATEAKMLVAFWEWAKYRLSTSLSAKFGGFNSNKFDLPFTVHRSWINGIKPAVRIMDNRCNVAEDVWLDLIKVWQCGNRENSAKANTVARALGAPAKLGDGGNFGAIWRESKVEGILYNIGDLWCERGIAEAMGQI